MFKKSLKLKLTVITTFFGVILLLFTGFFIYQGTKGSELKTDYVSDQNKGDISEKSPAEDHSGNSTTGEDIVTLTVEENGVNESAISSPHYLVLAQDIDKDWILAKVNLSDDRHELLEITDSRHYLTKVMAQWKRIIGQRSKRLCLFKDKTILIVDLETFIVTQILSERHTRADNSDNLVFKSSHVDSECRHMAVLMASNRESHFHQQSEVYYHDLDTDYKKTFKIDGVEVVFFKLLQNRKFVYITRGSTNSGNMISMNVFLGFINEPEAFARKVSEFEIIKIYSIINDEKVSCSLDGEFILISTNISLDTSNVILIDTGKGMQRIIHSYSSYDPSTVQISPSGKKIALIMKPDESNAEFIVKDSETLETIISTQFPTPLPSLQLDSWSEDEKYIIFSDSLIDEKFKRVKIFKKYSIKDGTLADIVLKND